MRYKQDNVIWNYVTLSLVTGQVRTSPDTVLLRPRLVFNQQINPFGKNEALLNPRASSQIKGKWQRNVTTITFYLRCSWDLGLESFSQIVHWCMCSLYLNSQTRVPPSSVNTFLKRKYLDNSKNWMQHSSPVFLAHWSTMSKTSHLASSSWWVKSMHFFSYLRSAEVINAPVAWLEK